MWPFGRKTGKLIDVRDYGTVPDTAAPVRWHPGAGIPFEDRPPGTDPVVANAVAQFLGATAISRIETSVGAIARAMEAQVENQHALNVALGEFRDKTVAPLFQELKFLRYNLGDKVNHTTTDLDAVVQQLDRVLIGALKAQGLTDKQIMEFREGHGIQPEAPRGSELEVHVDEVQSLRAQVRDLIAQNQRLLAQQPADGA